MFVKAPLLQDLTHVPVMFESAMREARMLDVEFATTSVLCGLLHGIPVSLKDVCVFL